MTENEQILHDTIESLRREFADNGQIEILTIGIYDLSFPGENIISANCSYIATEWEEAIYYDRDRKRYFFHGESPVFSYGGEKHTIPITGPLLSILPAGLQDALRRVATTGLPELVRLNDRALLE